MLVVERVVATCSRIGPYGVIVAGCCVLLVVAPTDGDFGWNDAPRHAMNGVFIHDFVAALPWRDPVGWAIAYYVQHPALTILFYPPLFPAMEAVVFGALGVSHFSAQFTVWLFVVVLALSGFHLARRLMPSWSATGAALLLVGAPEIAYWGRQVMTDIPAFALLASGLAQLLRFLDTGRIGMLAMAAALVLAAVWCKFTVVFAFPFLLLVVIMHRGMRDMRDRRVLLIQLAFILGMLPAAYLATRFSAINLESAAGRPGDLSLASAEAWLFYLVAIPAQLGWPACVLGFVGAFALRFRQAAQRWLILALIAWCGGGYIFFSSLGVREPRHDLMILLPLVICAPLALHRFLPGRWAQGAAVLLGGATLLWSAIWYPPATAGGFRAVAAHVAQQVPHGSTIVFSGYRDANFIFALRERWAERDLTVLRADKLFLSIAVDRERGVRQTSHDEAAIADMLRGYGVAAIVKQPGYFADLRQMARFERVVASPEYILERSFTMAPVASTNDARRMDVYMPAVAPARTRNDISLDMPIIGRRFDAQLKPQ